jgi:hypothetical protein
VRSVLIALFASASLGSAALAAEGRYTMTPVDGGFLRLDTETGDMALCQRKGATWSCEAMADSSRSLQKEFDRLAAENKELRAEIKRLEEIAGLGDDKKGGPEKRAERPGGGFRLPTEEDVDKVMGYVERMLKKFRDKLRELEEGDRRSAPL